MTTESQQGSTPTDTGAAPGAADTSAASRATLGGNGEGNPQGAAASVAGEGAEAGSNAWLGLQDEGNRAVVTSKGWKSVDDAIKSYAELEKRSGKALTVPGNDASPEEWAAFYDKAGRPKEASAYDLKRPDGIPEAVYDAKFAEQFKSWAHANGLNPQQAAGVHDAYVQFAQQQIGNAQQTMEARADAAHAVLVKAWGEPDRPEFQRNQELANRAIRNLGGNDLLQEMKTVGFLNANGEIMSPLLAQALAKAGAGLYSEDTMFGSANSHSKNPFSKEHENMGEQGKLIKEARSDPSKRDYVLSLLRNANVNPAEYGFSARSN